MVKKILKKIFLGILIILLVILYIFKITFNLGIGKYTGYQIEVISTWSGRGIDGRKLGSGIWIQRYNISENDFLYDEGETWVVEKELRPIDYHVPPSKPIVEIVSLGKNEAEIKVNGSQCTIKYNSERKSAYPKMIYFDGTNYQYSFRIIKKYLFII
jgi:hypothetical protein